MPEVKKKRVIRKAETVRQRVERPDKPAKKGILRTTVRTVTLPFRTLYKVIARILQPFAILLAPFRTKPFRLIWRVLRAVLLLTFFREAWRELRQVTWPTARETYRLTIAVFIFAVVFGAIVAALDEGLGIIFKKLFVD